MTPGSMTRHTDHNTQVDMPASYPLCNNMYTQFQFQRLLLYINPTFGWTHRSVSPASTIVHGTPQNFAIALKIDLSRNSFNLYPSVDGSG